MMTYQDFLEAYAYQVKAYAIINRSLAQMIHPAHAQVFIASATERVMADRLGTPAVKWEKITAQQFVIETANQTLNLTVENDHSIFFDHHGNPLATITAEGNRQS